MSLKRMPHDEFMKWMMSDLRVARGFFNAYLPSEVAQAIDLSTLSMQPTSFIDKRLKSRESDILYQVQQCDGEMAYVYLLVEHQKTSDPLMAFRLMQYIMQILDWHVRQREGIKQPVLPLPLVYPLVFYNGREKFSSKRDIFSLFGAQEELARTVFLKPFQLIDISKVDDETMREHQWAGLLEWCMRHSLERDFMPHLRNLGSFLRDLRVKSGDDLIQVMLNYIVSSMDSHQQVDAIVEALYEELPIELGGDVMTLAEKLMQKGMTEGIQKGKIEGAEATLIAIELFEQGYSLETAALKTGLSVELLRTLQKKIMH